MKPRLEVLNMPLLSWSTGAPEPFLVSSERKTFFAFRAGGDGVGDDEVRIGEFEGCISVRFGFPNDEVLNGHPLWRFGLQPYAAHEVLDSPWLAELRETERHHSMAADRPFPGSKHYVLTFHDSTLEAIATAILVYGNVGTMADAITLMTTSAFAR